MSDGAVPPGRLDYESSTRLDRTGQPTGLWTGALCGGTYGAGLAAVGLWAAGPFRPGLLVPLGVVSSPVGLVADPFAALVTTPVLWAALGWLLAGYRIGAFRRAFPAAMFVHYAAVPFLAFGTGFADWANLHKASGAAVLASIVYGVGQVLIWTAALGRQPHP